jgi:hypothetical protein
MAVPLRDGHLPWLKKRSGEDRGNHESPHDVGFRYPDFAGAQYLLREWRDVSIFYKNTPPKDGGIT